MSKRDEILDKVFAVKALPTAAVDSMRLMLNPNVDLGKLIQTLEYDPSLTTNILRLANSAEFGATRPMGTIREAVTRLGIQKVFKMVITSVIGPMAQQPIKGYDMPPGALWNHCIRVAIAVTHTGHALNLELPKYAFTSGLLVDVGKIVLGTYLEVDANKILSEAVNNDISFDEAERNVLGIDHAEVGAFLLRQWKLPEEIILPVQYHHRPNDCPENDVLVDCVHVADSISIMTSSEGCDGLHYELCSDAHERLKMQRETPEIIICHTQAEINRLNKAS